MAPHSQDLWRLASELLDPGIVDEVKRLANAEAIDLEDLSELDRRIGGPSISTINRAGTGNYQIADRDVFRPLQYCAMLFRNGIHSGELGWHARDIVEMSSLHIESLVKRIGNIFGLPLGALLARPIVRRRLDAITLDRLQRFTAIYNAAKHDLKHEKDSHLFSIPDAIAAYFVSRKLGLALYPLARLETDLVVFEPEAC